MEPVYDPSVFRGHLLKGNLRAAMAYLGQFPEQSERYEKYVSLFQEGHYLTYDVEAGLNELLLVYQQYYREVFYLERDPQEAARQMRGRFAQLLRLDDGVSLDDMEENQIAEAFAGRGLHFMGGRTGGYYGPYIWKTEELRHYTVELPDGTQDYAVMLLDDFVSNSWLDYLSFGETGTGGWSNGDGLIHCVKARYDLESESFQVSLLKHEAQHAMDQARYGQLTPEVLEYRAKLVELIYSSQRDMLSRFAAQADRTRAGDGHALAASRIAEGFERLLHRPREEFKGLSAGEVQRTARALFEESSALL